MTDTSHDTYRDTDRRDGTHTEAAGDPVADTQRQDPTVDPLDTSRSIEGDPAALPGLDDDATASQRSTVGDAPDRERLSTSDLANRGQQRSADGGRDAAPHKDDTPPLVTDPDSYLDRWQAVQAGFVDEPRSAVQDADALVAEVIQRIAEGFAQERDSLEKQWSGGENVDTEQLRIALQRYRSFFTRLLQT
jgi:hypothetical protein